MSRKKQLQRLKPAEDERKLQTNDITVSTEKSGPFLLQKKAGIFMPHLFGYSEYNKTRTCFQRKGDRVYGNFSYSFYYIFIFSTGSDF